MKFLPGAVKSEVRLARFLKKKLNFATKSLPMVKFISREHDFFQTQVKRKIALHMLRYMEISMYLPVLHMLRYMEISMYLPTLHMLRYMEISMYFPTLHMLRYMEISMYPPTPHMLSYMEISMYLPTPHMSRYMEISLYPNGLPVPFQLHYSVKVHGNFHA